MPCFIQALSVSGADNGKMAVTMKDIARELSLSVVTVSKVIRNNSDIGEETRQCVLKRITELNYQPNMAARALVTGRSYSAGLIVPELVHPFFAEIASGISDVLRRKNYSLISSSPGDPDLERQEIKRLLSRRLDALMIASTQETVESFRRIEEQKVPYALIDRAFLGMPANFVGVDDVAVGRLATEHFISAGCRKIGPILGLATSTAAGRFEAALHVPEDIAAIGCGNLHFDKSLRVPLSSVDQQSRAIGARAGKLVLSPIEAKIEPQPKSAMLQPSLVARASTRRLP